MPMIILGILLFCNPLALGLELWTLGAESPLTYINLVGTFLFGYFIRDREDARKNN